MYSLYNWTWFHTKNNDRLVVFWPIVINEVHLSSPCHYLQQIVGRLYLKIISFGNWYLWNFTSKMLNVKLFHFQTCYNTFLKFLTLCCHHPKMHEILFLKCKYLLVMNFYFKNTHIQTDWRINIHFSPMFIL